MGNQEVFILQEMLIQLLISINKSMGCCLQAQVQTNKPIISSNQPAPQPQGINQPSKKPNKLQAIKKQQNKIQQQVKSLTANHEEACKQNKKMNEDILALARKKNQLQNQLQKIREEQKILNQAIQDKSSRITALERQIISRKNEIQIESAVVLQTQSPLKPTNHTPKNSPTEKLGEVIARLELQVEEKSKSIEKEEKEKQKMRLQMNQINPQIQLYQEKINEVNHKIAKLKIDEQQTHTQIASQRISSEKALSQLKELKNKTKQNKDYITKFIKEIADIKEQTSLLKNQQKQKSNAKNQVSKSAYLKVFVGELLEGENEHRKFLVQILQNRMKRKIKGSKLIYKYDALNKVNFHKYIDNKSQIVVIVKLKNGKIVGAWSEGSFQPKMVSDKDGLIFSLTHRKAFEPIERNRRAIAYDDYFLIFGNSELRLKSQQIKVFSNFAISNGYYNPQGQKVDVLLGSGSNREVQMEGLQIFQLILE